MLEIAEWKCGSTKKLTNGAIFLPTNWRALCQFVAGSSVQFAALIHAMKS